MEASQFLSIASHGAILFCLFFSREDYVLASLPPLEEMDKLALMDMDTWLVIALSLSLASLLLELFFYFYLIHPPQLMFFALITHTIACLVLLKFTIDEHPVGHFWMAFGLFNCPLIFAQLCLFIVRNYSTWDKCKLF